MPFGHSQLEHWPLDPNVLYLNHGTVGVVPRRVLAYQQSVRDEIERNPSRFLLRELTAIRHGVAPQQPPRMRVAAAAVAAFLGVAADDLVFVDNATTGVNAVLRSFDFRPGDEILVSNLTYGAVRNTALYVARVAGAEVRTVELPWPPSPETIVQAWVAAAGPRARIAIVDHITSESGLRMPVPEIAAALSAAGVAVLVDGAHAPGSIPLDLDALGVDWYTGNLHKWMWTPRSSGILWARPERRAALHPTVISWGLDHGLSAEFDLPGTRDPSTHLSAPAAIEAMQAHGVEAVQAWNHRLAWEAAAMLADRFETRIEQPESMIAAMVTLPLPARFGSVRDDAQALRDALLFEDGIEIQLHAWRERLWIRISAQIYNEMSDYERLAKAVLARG